MKYNIEDLKLKLLIKYPFWSSILANITFAENEDIPTAGTDGKMVISYNPNYLNSLTGSQQLFVLAHELCHIAFNHMERRKDKDMYTWNIATDAVINDLLVKNDKLSLPPGVVQIEDAILSDSEEIYEKLMNGSIDRNQITGNKDSKGNTTGHASHDSWGSSKTDTSNSTNESGNDSKDKYTSEKEIFNKNKKMKKKLLKELMDQLSKEATKPGTGTNEEKFKLDGIDTSMSTKIDWRTLLNNNSYRGELSSYSNSYLEDYIITPGMVEDTASITEILLDTSGSVNHGLLRLFLKECKKVLKCSKIKVGCFDTKFYGFKTIRTEKDIDDFEFQGGGGTNFDVAVNAFSHGNINRVVFTDGMSDAPKKIVPALWIIYGNCVIHPQGARVINISIDDLRTSSLIRRKVK